VIAMTPNDSSIWVGRVIEQYQIMSLIAAGGMGVVYLARDRRLGRNVAFKVLPEEFSKDHEHVLRSEREARMLASLNHPNIAGIYDFKEVDGNRCLILEYVDGETLAERLKRGRVPVTEILDICRQIAEALEAAHRTGIVHHDIKPANIKVTSEGRCKVLDFGLAKSLVADQPRSDPSDAPTMLTGVLVETIMGTPAYMSPEQLRGGIMDRRADIWAFGCVMYELLVGRPAFSGNAVSEIIAAVLKDEPDWTALPQDTPTKLRDLVARCLAKDPSRRPGEIAGAFEGMESDSETLLPNAADTAPAVRSLAVLPFVNAGGNPEMDYLSDGLTESIILNLSQLPELRVMARSTVFRYKGRSDEARDIGRTLGVSTVLTGRVLHRGDMLLISVELADVENGWQLWGDQYRRKSADIFAIEEDIAGEISEKLRLKLSPERKSLLARRYTENVAAYHLYLKGRFHWAKRTAEGLQRGIRYFHEAIEGDPTYALAYAGLAEGYVPLGFYCHVAPKDAFPKAKSAAMKALEIDPELCEARTVLAAVKVFFDWTLADAEKEARAAIDIDPKYARARQVLSECLIAKGDAAESVAEIKRGLDLDPLSLHTSAAVSMMLYFGRQYDEAIEYGLRTVEMDSTFFPAYLFLGFAYLERKQYSEAVAALQKGTELSGNMTLMQAAIGSAFAFSGRTEEARRILAALDEARGRYVSQTSIAAIYAGLGEIGSALTCLERAFEDRCSWLLRSLVNDPRLDRLRDQPRFHDLARRVGIAGR